MRLKVTLLSDGSCVQLEKMAIRDGTMRRIRFASMFALIEHPRVGPILFDTGYTRRFFEETKRFPAKLYGLITPTRLANEDDAVNQLRASGGDAR